MDGYGSHAGAPDAGPRRARERSALRAAWTFAAVGAAWVLLTNALIHVNVQGWARFWVQTGKGFVFVAATTVFLVSVMRGLGVKLQRSDDSARERDDALRRSEARYRALVERVPGVVWLNEVDPTDPDRTHCVYVAPQLEYLLGYTPREWMADDDLWLKVVHPEDVAEVTRQNDLADVKGTLSVEYRALHRDGSIVWIHDEAVLIPGDGERPEYWQGVMVDITTQRIQGEALRELTESLRAVFDASPLAVMVLERDGRVRHWNPAAERMFGWRASEVIGKPVPYVPEDRRAEFEGLLRRELEGGSFAGFETVRMHRDGTPIDVSLSVAPLTDAEGRVNGVLGVVEDVTERRRVADELLNRQRQQAAVAALGLSSLRGADLTSLLDEAARVVAGTLDIEVVGVFELPPGEDVLRLRAATGWLGSDGEIDVDGSALATYALHAGEPVVSEDVAADQRLSPREILRAHGVVSAVATAVHGTTRPIGVLEALSSERRSFSRDDVRFVQSVAAIVGHALERARAEDERQRALDRQRRLSTRLELLHEVDRDVLSARSIDEMAGRALEHLRHLVPFDRGSVALIDEETGTFADVAVRHPPHMGPVPDPVAHVPDRVARALLARDVVSLPDLDDAADDTPYVAIARRLGIRSILSIALLADDGQLGILVLSSRTPLAFDEEAVDIAREVGSELAVAIRQTRLREAVAERAEQLERLAEERRQMLHRIVRAQEEERERVALELHDGLGQVLTSISLFATDLETELPPVDRPRAARVTELVRRAIVDSRRLVWSLRPPELERLGLVPALRRLSEELSTPDVTVDLHERIGELRLGPETEAVVYRVVQEAVHNAQKHAGSTAISILLHRRRSVLSTLVEDNGRGFDPLGVPTGRGFGLVGMRERAELVGGHLVIESAVGAGTRVRLDVPIVETAAPGPRRREEASVSR